MGCWTSFETLRFFAGSLLLATDIDLSYVLTILFALFLIESKRLLFKILFCFFAWLINLALLLSFLDLDTSLDSFTL